MATIFMNSKNSKTPKLHVLILKLTNKLDLRAHRQISKKRGFEKYCSYDQACQFSAL